MLNSITFKIWEKEKKNFNILDRLRESLNLRATIAE
jgi:hypothetical protein